MKSQLNVRDWAEDVFGHASLGDSRRTRRLVRVATEAAQHPGGKVLEVCRSSATRQGAYDFLSNANVSPEAVQDAVSKASAFDCRGERFCFVVIDGTALTLSDWQRKRTLGRSGRPTSVRAVSK